VRDRSSNHRDAAILHRQVRWTVPGCGGVVRELKPSDVHIYAVADQAVGNARHPAARLVESAPRSEIGSVASECLRSTQARYPHGHVPSPVQLADHVGDTARAQRRYPFGTPVFFFDISNDQNVRHAGLDASGE
jgi:hypothetical protein